MSAIRLNGISIEDVPDLYNFKEFKGFSAYDIFSSGSLIGAVGQNAESLGIDLKTSDASDLPKYLSAALESGSERIRSAAESIASDFGRRLGLIFFAMKTASEKTRFANDRYEDEDWRPWTGVNKIFLSGGLANGKLGENLCRYANELIKELGVIDVNICTSRYPSHDQLIGCARANSDNASRAVVFDFGHSFVKSAVASYAKSSEGSHGVVRLDVDKKIPSRHMGRGYTDADAEYKEAVLLHEFIANVVASRFSRLSEDDKRLPPSRNIVISIANNVSDGSIGYGGCYYKLMLVSPKYEEYLSNFLSELLERDVTVKLIHDGQAAALSVAGEKNSVLVALGTAFGVGFPPESDEGLRPAENLIISG